MPPRLKAYLYLTTTALLWGIASPVIKYTLQFIEPFSFLFWRFFIVSIIFLPLFIVFIRKSPISLKDYPKLIFLVFLGSTLNLSLLFIGYKYPTSIDGVLISAIAPILIIVGGAMFLKEEVTKKEKAGAAIALTGSIVTIIQPVLEGVAFPIQNLKGNILVFLAALSWAIFTIVSKKDFKKRHPFVITSFMFIVGFATIIPFFVWETSRAGLTYTTLLPSTQALPGLLYMSFFSSIIAYFTYNMGVSLIEASEATLFAYLQPIFAAPLAVLWLGERITLPFLLGATLILAGVILTEWKNKKQLEIKK